LPRAATKILSTRPHAHVPHSAILLITVAVLCFSALDGIVKFLTQRYSVPLLVWARYGMQALLMVIWFFPQMKWALLTTRRLRLQVLRGLILPGSSLCFFTALKYLPLAEATAINYSTPVLVMILAVIFLHERMTGPRIAVVIAGVAGMLIIVRPGSAMFHGAALLCLCAAGFYATFQILTRKLASDDPRVTLFYPALVGTLVMTAVLPFYAFEVDMPWFDVTLLVATGLIGTIGHFMFILAFQRAPASGLTPFTYMQLVWATIVGWLFFGSFPDVWTLAGMAVIAGSGLLIALHERRRARETLREPTVVE
jgi:drug/metabolite transporter (DMT)-like permease